MTGKKQNYSRDEAITYILSIPYKTLSDHQKGIRNVYSKRIRDGNIGEDGYKKLLETFGCYVHKEAIHRFSKYQISTDVTPDYLSRDQISTYTNELHKIDYSKLSIGDVVSAPYSMESSIQFEILSMESDLIELEYIGTAG